jgi:hypothetical protein
MEWLYCMHFDVFELMNECDGYFSEFILFHVKWFRK